MRFTMKLMPDKLRAIRFRDHLPARRWYHSRNGTTRQNPAGTDIGQSRPAQDGIARQFHEAWQAAGRQDGGLELLPVRLAQACVAVLPVSGAGISLLYDDFRVPLGASDDAASCAEQLQFTTGEGPCLQA